MAKQHGTKLDRNLRWNNINGVFSTLSQNMLMPFTGIFAIKLGATDAQIAALSSWPALVSLFAMIPGARMVDRFPRKQKLVAGFMIMNRIFFLLLSLMPLIIRDESRRPLLFVAMIAIMNIPGAVANVAWQSFIGNVIPGDRRAMAIATRNQLMGFCGVIASLIAGKVMDNLNFPVGFQVMFFIGFVLALLEIAAFLRIEETPAEQPARAPRQQAGLGAKLRHSWQVMKGYPGYWRFAAASLTFYFGWMMGGPLFTKYQVQELHTTSTWVSIISVCSTIGSVLVYPIWARLSERYGNKRLLIFSTMGMAFTPVFYAISTQPWMLAALSVVVGFATAGTLLMLFNGLLEVSPEQDRTQYIAYHNTATGVVSVLSPYVAIAMVAAGGIRMALLGAAFFRGLGALAFMAVYLIERKQARARRTARVVGE